MKIFFLCALALAVSGCIAIPTGPSRGGTQYFLFLQVGIVVRVVNNCAPLLDLERVEEIVVEGLPYGSSITVPLVSTPFTGSHRSVPLTAKGYTERREYLGSATKTFHVSTYRGTHSEIWEVDYLRLPGGRGGCQ